jgi:CheY-like chemotaxis protein
MKILIVEDESLSVLFLQCLLKQLNFTDTKAVPSGELAIELVDTWKPDLVFMDIQLAGEMDGIETTTKLLCTISCPVIYATGYDSEEIMTRAWKSGAADYLVKPLFLESVRDAINKIFKSPAS